MMKMHSLALTKSGVAVLLVGLAFSACESDPPAEQEEAGEMAVVATAEGVLNPNQASPEQLAAVPHFTAELVQAVIDGRPHLTTGAFNALLSQSLDETQLTEALAVAFLPINLNTASGEEILSVPGVGARMHHEFEEYRPYVAMEQFRREMAKYVDDTEVDRLAQYVFVPIDLNTATDEVILSVPGIGDRMLHEFKEYRPYTNIAQFRREMGKYVDDDEVARMERYVEVR